AALRRVQTFADHATGWIQHSGPGECDDGSLVLMCKLRSRLAVAAMTLASAHIFAQHVTLSGRVKLVSGDKQAESPQAGDVVVWLTPLDSHTPLKPFHAGPLKLVQHNKSFEPHLLVVPVGAVVEFPNRDPFFHNVFSL